jgi:hypothetical protein
MIERDHIGIFGKMNCGKSSIMNLLTRQETSIVDATPGTTAEACNHSRIVEDIGTVQIPSAIRRRRPGVVIEHNFGREFQENDRFACYKLVIHCGGCMISAQKLLARIRDLDATGVPYTNYGVFLAYMQGREALCSVLQPWGIDWAGAG